MKQLWYGGTIYTMEQEHETVDAVLVEGGRIVATGAFDALQNQADEQIDLQGAVMYPGFVDSHLHLIALGENLSRLDLSTATSAEEMLDLLTDAAKKTPPNRWLFGEGWNDNHFTDKRLPTKEE